MVFSFFIIFYSSFIISGNFLGLNVSNNVDDYIKDFPVFVQDKTETELVNNSDLRSGELKREKRYISLKLKGPKFSSEVGGVFDFFDKNDRSYSFTSKDTYRGGINANGGDFNNLSNKDVAKNNQVDMQNSDMNNSFNKENIQVRAAGLQNSDVNLVSFNNLSNKPIVKNNLVKDDGLKKVGFVSKLVDRGDVSVNAGSFNNLSNKDVVKNNQVDMQNSDMNNSFNKENIQVRAAGLQNSDVNLVSFNNLSNKPIVKNNLVKDDGLKKVGFVSKLVDRGDVNVNAGSFNNLSNKDVVKNNQVRVVGLPTSNVNFVNLNESSDKDNIQEDFNKSEIEVAIVDYLEDSLRVREEGVNSKKINCINGSYSNDQVNFEGHHENSENNAREEADSPSGLIEVNSGIKNSDKVFVENFKEGSRKKESKGLFEKFCDRHVEYCDGFVNFFSEIFQFQLNLHLFSYKFLIFDTFFLHVYPEITNLNLFIWRKNWVEGFIKEVVADINILIQFNYMFFMGMNLILFKEKDLFFRASLFRFGPIFRLLIGRVFINSGFEFDWRVNSRKFEKKWKFYFSIGYKMYYDAAIYPCFKFK